MRKKVIKLYWWEEPNVGDAASYDIVKWLSRRNVKWAYPQISIYCILRSMIYSWLKRRNLLHQWNLKDYVFPWKKCLFAVGSILDWANSKTVVWGSGFREYNSHFLGRPTIFAVRGTLSLHLLPLSYKNSNISIGDPALLLPMVYPPLC